MSLVTLRDSRTNKIIQFDSEDKKAYKLKKLCRGLDEIAELNNLKAYFLTLTMGQDTSVAERELHRFLTFVGTRFKRAGLLFKYVWVLELQKKRYIRTGVKALHWHFAIIAPDGSLPDVEFRQQSLQHYFIKSEGSVIEAGELYERWGRGQIFCCKAYHDLTRYLSKYLGKGDTAINNIAPEWSKLRRIGSSNLGVYRYPEWAKTEIKKLEDFGVPVKDLYAHYQASTIKIYAVEYHKEWDGLDKKIFRVAYFPDALVYYKHLIYKIQSPYRQVTSCPITEFLTVASTSPNGGKTSSS